MKRSLAIASVILLLTASLPIYIWFQYNHPPDTLADLDGNLRDTAFAYEVIDDAPLVLMPSSAGIVLDVLDFHFPTKNLPPTHRWEYTGNWVPISDQTATVSADLTSEFGPRVVFGIIQNPEVTKVEIRRDGTTILVIEPQGSGYIHLADDIQFGDEVVFLNSDGDLIRVIPLKQSTVA